MRKTPPTLSRLLLPSLAVCFGVGVYVESPFQFRDMALAQEDDGASPAPVQTPAQTKDDQPVVTSTAPSTQPAGQAPDPAADLARKRDQTRAELEELSKTISLSSDKTKALEDSIASLDKSTASLRQALIDSAAPPKGHGPQDSAEREDVDRSRGQGRHYPQIVARAPRVAGRSSRCTGTHGPQPAAGAPGDTRRCACFRAQRHPARRRRSRHAQGDG